jgi:hypothetical protein
VAVKKLGKAQIILVCFLQLLQPVGGFSEKL